MNKMEALKYLVKNSVYDNEWTGAGMYEELARVIKSKKKEYTKEELDKMLARAYGF